MSLPTLQSVFSADQIDILQQWINAQVLLGNTQVITDSIPEGTTDATTSHLAFGVNTISEADSGNYAIRLPYPPKKGKTVTIVNLTQFPISVYPSITGGSINNVVDGVAVVPPDAKQYIFTCYENPLPGAWTWTPPATNQYDSGIITISHTNGVATRIVCASNASKVVGTTFPSITAYQSLIAQTGYFYPPTPYNAITRIKFYTNIPLALDGFSAAQIDINQYNWYVGGSGSSTGASQPMNAEITSGPTNAPAQIGDDGTIFADIATSSIYSPDDLRLKSGTFFYTPINKNINVFTSIWIELSSALPTDTYEVRFFIEYN